MTDTLIHHWLRPLNLAEALEKTNWTRKRQALDSLIENLPLFQQIQRPQLETSWATIVSRINSFTDVIVLGTGGSSLGAQTLCALSNIQNPRLHFMENIDTDSFERLWASINPGTTFCIVISKSGQTTETCMQLLISQQHWPKNALPEHFLVVTQNNTKQQPNTLRAMAETLAIPCFDHPQIGGRYSCFSVVGLLPAAIAGLCVEDILGSARQYWQAQMQADVCEPLRAASYLHTLLQQGKTQSVMMPYCDRLRPFSRWYAQLWAESLGKNGKGMTPLPAIGAVDQHSQLQLYLDGPQDKVFTLITLAPQSSASKSEAVQTDLVPIFHGKSMSDLMAASQRATLETLDNHDLPVREIRLEALNEKTIGALMMHFILETLAMSLFLEVDPFTQPAVEEGKRLAQQYL